MTLDELGQILLDLYKDGLRSHNKEASGALYRETSYEVEINENHYIVYFNIPVYWKYVEYGRKAGGKFPPRDAIRQWIQVKPLIPDARFGKIPSIDSLVYLVSRKIATKGIKPTPVMEEALDNVGPYIDEFVMTLTNATIKTILNILDEE